MNEINLNALSRSVGIDKSLNSVANFKNVSPEKAKTELDSVQFSNLPDLSAAEHALEEEFAAARSNLQNSANSASYPPLDTIDRLAAMLAIHLDPRKSDLPQ